MLKYKDLIFLWAETFFSAFVLSSNDGNGRNLRGTLYIGSSGLQHHKSYSLHLLLEYVNCNSKIMLAVKKSVIVSDSFMTLHARFQVTSLLYILKFMSCYLILVCLALEKIMLSSATSMR